MPRNSAFTLVEAIVTCIILLLLVLILLPSRKKSSSSANSTICGHRQKGIATATLGYASSHRERLPIVGVSDPYASAIGFGEGDRTSKLGARLDNNATAALWLLVRDGSVAPKYFVCPSDKNAGEDPLTDDGNSMGQPVDLASTNDFYSPRNLSFSMMNMHHAELGKKWKSTSNSDVVLMADDNNNTEPDRHIFSLGGSWSDIARAENALHHVSRKGQNVLFADGHSSFEDYPFVGPGGDNIFAMLKGGKNTPPTLGNSDGDGATDPAVAETDTVLLPITGNGGGAGSLDPKD